MGNGRNRDNGPWKVHMDTRNDQDSQIQLSFPLQKSGRKTEKMRFGSPAKTGRFRRRRGVKKEWGGCRELQVGQGDNVEQLR